MKTQFKLNLKRTLCLSLLFVAAFFVGCKKDETPTTKNYYCYAIVDIDEDESGTQGNALWTELNAWVGDLNANYEQTKFIESEVDKYLETAYTQLSVSMAEFIEKQSNVEDFCVLLFATDGQNTLESSVKRLYVQDGQILTSSAEAAELIGGALVGPNEHRGKYLKELKGCWGSQVFPWFTNLRQRTKNILRDKGGIKLCDILDADLNMGGEGAYVFIGGKFDDNPQNAITGIIGFCCPGSYKNSPKVINYDGITYHPVVECDHTDRNLDLNKGDVSSDCLVLYYTTDTLGVTGEGEQYRLYPITSLKVISEKPLSFPILKYPDTNYGVCLKEKHFDLYECLDLNTGVKVLRLANVIRLGFDRDEPEW